MGEREQKLLFHIDDRDPRNKLFADIARDLGAKILHCSSGQEAVDVLKEQVPDILITSLHYDKKNKSKDDDKDLTGKDVAKAARKAGVSHIIITTNAEMKKMKGVEVLDIPGAVDRLTELARGGNVKKK